jgi:predicted DNA-binding transcriptional regulator AlpA
MTELNGKQLGLSTVKGKLLTSKEIADFLRVSDRWVRSHMNDGTFPFTWYPIGERNHVADSWDFDQWLSSIKVQAGTVLLPKRSVNKILEEEVCA